MPTPPGARPSLSPYLKFNRQEWAALRANTPSPLSGVDLAALRGLNSSVSLDDVADIYLPLSRLLNLHVTAARTLGTAVESAFLGRPSASTPYVIAVAGSVAVGKSTFARVLQAALGDWAGRPRVDLVTTDGFLHPTRVLEERDLMARKGFPESYDLRAIIAFLSDLKAGVPNLTVPVYSHETYDLLPGQVQQVDRPDILLFEGLNVLQTTAGASVVASDFFDFSIYLDADTDDIGRWYKDRFLLLQRTAFQRPGSYFHRYRALSPAEAEEVAGGIWREINLPNLLTSILPTRERARLVVRMDASHAIDEVWLRRA